MEAPVALAEVAPVKEPGEIPAPQSSSTARGVRWSRRAGGLAATLVLGWVLGGFSSSSGQTQNGGAFCDSPFYYVGTTDDQRSFEVDHVFRISNPTSAPLQIVSAEAACGCSKKGRQAYHFEYNPEIPAHSEAALKIGFPVAPVAGVPDIREFVVRFEPREIREMDLTVLSKRLDALTLFPGGDLLFHRVKGKATTRTVYLVSKSFKPLTVEITGPPIPGLSVRSTPVTESLLRRQLGGRQPDLHLPKSVWDNGGVVAVRIEVDSSVHAMTGRIRLETNYSEGPEVFLNLSVF